MNASDRDQHDPIRVFINSDGGEIDALLSMLSVMDCVNNPFLTICTGRACSAGAVLLSNGDGRFVGPHARVMIHEASVGTGGHITDFQATAEEFKKVNDLMMGILARNIGKPVKELRKLLSQRRDFYFSAREAVDFGLADAVGIPSLRSPEPELLFPQPANRRRGWQFYQKSDTKPRRKK
jgi:ATP-dependent Clp protease protease subunit